MYDAVHGSLTHVNCVECGTRQQITESRNDCKKNRRFEVDFSNLELRFDLSEQNFPNQSGFAQWFPNMGKTPTEPLADKNTYQAQGSASGPPGGITDQSDQQEKHGASSQSGDVQQMSKPDRPRGRPRKRECPPTPHTEEFEDLVRRIRELPPKQRQQAKEQALTTIRADRRLTRLDREIAYYLVSSVNWSKGFWFSSQNCIADKVHCSARSVRRGIVQLERYGHIAVRRHEYFRQKQLANDYAMPGLVAELDLAVEQPKPSDPHVEGLRTEKSETTDKNLEKLRTENSGATANKMFSCPKPTDSSVLPTLERSEDSSLRSESKTLQNQEIADAEFSEVETKPTEQAPTSGQLVLQDIEPPQQEPQIRALVLTGSSTPPKVHGRFDYGAEFDAFWKAYPRTPHRKDKIQAWKWFVAITSGQMDDPNEGSPITITAAELINRAERYARTNPELRYVPAPFRWLRNAQFWGDAWDGFIASENYTLTPRGSPEHQPLPSNHGGSDCANSEALTPQQAELEKLYADYSSGLIKPKEDRAAMVRQTREMVAELVTLPSAEHIEAVRKSMVSLDIETKANIGPHDVLKNLRQPEAECERQAKAAERVANYKKLPEVAPKMQETIARFDEYANQLFNREANRIKQAETNSNRIGCMISAIKKIEHQNISYDDRAATPTDEFIDWMQENALSMVSAPWFELLNSKQNTNGEFVPNTEKIDIEINAKPYAPDWPFSSAYQWQEMNRRNGQ